MRPLSLSGVTCPYLLLVVGFIFIAMSPTVTSYAIPSTIVATTTKKDGTVLLEPREPFLHSDLQTSSNSDDALSTDLDLKPLPGSTASSSISGDHDLTLSSSDIFSSTADSLSSTADTLFSAANTFPSTADNIFSNDGNSPSILDSLTSTANGLSSTADVIQSTADLPSSSSYNVYPIDDPALGKDGGLLLASYGEPHCGGGVALCCTGPRLLDGALVEHCDYCMYSVKKPPLFFYYALFRVFRLCITQEEHIPCERQTTITSH